MSTYIEMKFSSESQLVDRIDDIFGRYLADIHNLKFKKLSMLAKKEVCLGWGIADVVMSFAEKSTTKSDQFRQPILSLATITVLQKMPQDEMVELNKLSEDVGISKSTLKNKYLKFLISNHLVEEIKKNEYLKRHVLNNENQDVIAFEAKLTNWKRALYQASRYKLFADLSYVVIDSTNLKPAIKNLDLFKKQGIGLVGISLSGKTELVLKAKKRAPTSNNLKILAMEMLLKTPLEKSKNYVPSNQSKILNENHQTYQQVVNL